MDTRDVLIETSQGSVRARIIHLANGWLFIISDSEELRLGLAAMAIPQGEDSIEPPSTALLSPGTDSVLIQAMAQRLAVITRVPCMVVASIKHLDRGGVLEVIAALRSHLVT